MQEAYDKKGTKNSEGELQYAFGFFTVHVVWLCLFKTNF